ncbi:MAG: hypothetical protein HQL32_15575 [Planctomycetes bacterium]|nr:hypothetical protein [Planctomycetota bacterium]
MKLSQIKTLSWALSLTGLGVTGYYGYELVDQQLKKNPPQQEEWVPGEVDISKTVDKRLIDRRQIMNALAFLTKIEIPPEIIKPVEIEPVAAVVDQAPPKLETKITLQLISYDDTMQSPAMAFLKSDKHKPSHPYYEGEQIDGATPRVHLYKIHKTYVVIRDDKKSESILKLQTTSAIPTAKGAYGSRTRPAVATVIPPEAEPKKEEPKKEVKSNNTANTRSYPKSRDVTRDNTYGISIVEYDSGNPNERRFAISEADQKKLENNVPRLMSEVRADVAYTDSGDAYGLRLNFMTDNALLSKYGFKDTDVVTHVDDTPVNSVDQGMNLYQNMDSSKRRVRATIERDKKQMYIWMEMDDFKAVKPSRK